MDQLPYRDNNSNKKQRSQTITYAIWGGAVVAILLLLTTVWISGSAQEGADQAVSRVSEFYLEELAGRRAQVVYEDLKNNFAHMENALGILEDSDLESQETLQSFLKKVKTLYGVDEFALVDENDMVYTANGVVLGREEYGNDYDFLFGELAEPVIRTPNFQGERKQMVLATPAEGIFFQGTRVRTCFIRSNIDEMLSYLTLQTSDNET